MQLTREEKLKIIQDRIMLEVRVGGTEEEPIVQIGLDPLKLAEVLLELQEETNKLEKRTVDLLELIDKGLK